MVIYNLTCLERRGNEPTFCFLSIGNKSREKIIDGYFKNMKPFIASILY